MPKYRCTTSVVWDFDSDLSQEEALAWAETRLDSIDWTPVGSPGRIDARLEKVKDRVDRVVLGEFRPEEFLPFLAEGGKREYEVGGTKYLVRMNSHRYFTFRDCPRCVACGLAGTRLFLERLPTDKSPHFNLYGEVDGRLVLLTKDHIHAKAFGGEDCHSNYQTMCQTCNSLKGHSHLTLEGLRALRSVLDGGKGRLPKKKLHSLLEEARAALATPWPDRTARILGRGSVDAVVVISDVHLFRRGDEVLGVGVYDVPPRGHRLVGCIRRGTVLEPLVATRDRVMCKLGGDEVVVLGVELVS